MTRIKVNYITKDVKLYRRKKTKILDMMFGEFFPVDKKIMKGQYKVAT